MNAPRVITICSLCQVADFWTKLEKFGNFIYLFIMKIVHEVHSIGLNNSGKRRIILCTCIILGSRN